MILNILLIICTYSYIHFFHVQVNFRLHSQVGGNSSSDLHLTSSSFNQGNSFTTMTQEFSCPIYLTKLTSSIHNNNHNRLNNNVRLVESLAENSDESTDLLSTQQIVSVIFVNKFSFYEQTIIVYYNEK